MCSFDIGIVILNYNCSDDTMQCMSVIMNSIKNLSYKMFIIDNCSNSAEKNKLSNIDNKRVEIIYAPRNGGYSYGNNIGIKKAMDIGCKNILIVNPDIIIFTEAIEYLNNMLNSSEQILLVGPKIVDANLNVDRYAQRFKKHTLKMCYMLKYPLSKINIGSCISEYFNNNRNFDENVEIFTTSGCCVMFSRKYFEKFGLFDESFFMFSEEVIWGQNIYNSEKYKAVYVGKAVAIHNHPHNYMKTKPYVIINKMSSDILFCRKYLKCSKLVLFPLLIYYILSYFFFIHKKEYREGLQQLKKTICNIYIEENWGTS